MVALTIFLFLLVSSVGGLYEDQIDNYDWHQQYVGHVSWLSFEQVAGGRRKVLLASETGVIAGVNAGSGNIGWRQEVDVAQGGIRSILHHKSTLMTLSGSDPLIMRGWEADTGVLKWEAVVSTLARKQDSIPLYTEWNVGGVLATLGGNKNDQVIVVSENVLYVLSTRTGRQLWRKELPDGTPCLIQADGPSVSVWAMTEGRLQMWTVNITTKTDPEPSRSLLAPWLSDETSCAVMSTAIICRDNADNFYIADSSDTFYRAIIEGSVPNHPVLRTSCLLNHIHIDNNLVKYDTTSHRIISICTGCHMTSGQSEGGQEVLVTIDAGDRTLSVKTSDAEEVIDTGVDRGDIVEAKLFVFRKGDKVNWRAAVTNSDGSVSLVSNKGEVVWTREEALAQIVSVEMVDLPPLQSSSSEFLSLLQPDTNPLTLAITRWSLQASLAQNAIKSMIEKGVASLLVQPSSEELLRDHFNVRKVIVVITDNGKAFGLDSSNGNIIWQLYLPHLRPFSNGEYLLHLLRSSSHPPHPPSAIVVGVANGCKGSVLYAFNPITGELTNQDEACLSYHVSQDTVSSLMDGSHQHVIFLLDEEGVVHCYPEGCDLSDIPPTFMYTVDNSVNSVAGVRVQNEGEEAKKMWNILVPKNEKILTLASKPREHDHSVGRVLSDRSIQYKYLNPNLVGIATQTADSPKSTLNIYLVDVVTGGLVHHATHQHSSGPVEMVLSENWLVYHYYNTKAHRNELAVIELYDPRNETGSVWSSVAPPTLPVITSQSYTFPSSILTMSLTSTQRGITHKNILLGLNSGHIAAVHKMLLDPRRNITPTQEMMEESLPPYVPEIVIKPKAFINYNKTVSGIRGIYTAPSGLESTSIVFAYGLDLFLTRVTPSHQFDMLAEDFDYWLIASVVGGLLLATLVLSQMSKRKSLRLLWK